MLGLSIKSPKNRLRVKYSLNAWNGQFPSEKQRAGTR
jgi:hypothetical protein